MDFIIVRRGAYTWIISEWYVYFACGILSYGITKVFIIGLTSLSKRLEKEKTISKPINSKDPDSKRPQNPNFGINRGGEDNIVRCFRKSGIYEIIDEGLKKAVQRVLGREGKFTIAVVEVVLLAFVIKDNPGQVMLRSGVEVFFTNKAKTLAISVFLLIAMPLLAGIAAPNIILLGIPVQYASVVGTFSLTAALTFGSLAPQNCNNFVYKLPEINGIPYVQQIDIRKDKVFIKTEPDDQLDLLVLQPSQRHRFNKDKECTHEVRKEFDTKGITSLDEAEKLVKIKTTCSSAVTEIEYLPLKEKTKTFDDVVHENDTKNLKKSLSARKNYEKSRQSASDRYKQKREEIKKNRANVNVA